MNKRIEKSMDIFNRGFKTKSDKTEAIKNITREYEIVTNALRDKILDMRSAHIISDEESENLYWGFPSLHNWKPKHSETYSVYFPSDVVYIETIVEMRDMFKNAEIVKMLPKTSKINEVETYIKNHFDISEKRFIQALNMVEIFGKLNVSVNPHIVINQFGHSFIRCFYYLNGKIMALSTIIAVAEKIENDNK